MDPATMQMMASMFGGGGGGGGFGASGFGGGSSPIGKILSGLFGQSDRPYKDAMKEYERYAGKVEGVQNPFLEFGKKGMGGFESWLEGMKDPSGFINNLMGKYSESPWAKLQQNQAMRAAQNQGSASGLTGSTPLTQFAQQNAKDISSQDMNQWLGNVLGINTQYGQGLGHQIGVGQNAANALTGFYGDMGRNMGEAAYGARAGKNQDRNSIWGGLFG